MVIEDNPSNDLQLLLADDESEITKPDTDLPEDEETEDSEETDSEDVESDSDEETESEDSKDDSEDDEENPDEKVGANFPDRPTYRQLKEYDPKLFKKFPGLRNTFFREREFTKIYPTVEDAQEAYENLTRLQAGEQRVSNGDPEDFLAILSDYDPGKERNFIQNFLPALAKRNKQAFLAVTEPVLKRALHSMYLDAKRNSNENALNSAMNVHEWLFGDDKIDSPAKIDSQTPSNQPDPEKEELKRQNERIRSERHNEFTSDILSTASHRLKSKILKDIPEDVSDFTRNSIAKEVFSELGRVLRDDPAHRSTMDRLLRQAGKENYSAGSKDRILTAYLSRAILGIPGILKKVKAEALKGAKPRTETPKRANGNNSSVPRKDASKLNPDNVKAVKSGKISALDFLNS